MYTTTAYLYQQIHTVLLVDISGAYFDRRWDPVYAKNLTLNLGVDNVLLFQFLNQDQKPVNITGATFTFRIISQNGENLLFAKELASLNNTLGRAKVTITAAETLAFQAQPAGYSIEISSGVLDQAVFTDDQAGARGVIDIVDSVFPAFVSSRVLTVPDQAPVGNVYYSSTLTTDGDRLTTFQIDTGDYIGNLSVEGATASADTDPEWYDIDFQDLATGNTVGSISIDSARRIGVNVLGYHPYIRLELTQTSGDIQTILYR